MSPTEATFHQQTNNDHSTDTYNLSQNETRKVS